MLKPVVSLLCVPGDHTIRRIHHVVDQRGGRRVLEQQEALDDDVRRVPRVHGDLGAQFAHKLSKKTGGQRKLLTNCRQEHGGQALCWQGVPPLGAPAPN